MADPRPPAELALADVPQLRHPAPPSFQAVMALDLAPPVWRPYYARSARILI